ncbi:winged helix-turn-helix transcriptional regulator [Paenibacillus albidus]|uniref:winged helix-turn-helix transcriptional regulator n=1 Tax=Paenibacillus albidus TaxID=2041023 RepID=UPI001E53F4C9|nr:helix-turn-helix domain-containing protein [Paenibacillus albidus]
MDYPCPHLIARWGLFYAYFANTIIPRFGALFFNILSENKVMRFNELKRFIGTISFKTLSIMLKELEADGLIIRMEFPQVPPKVEYSLSEHGLSLITVLNMMCEWGEKNNVPALGAVVIGA